MTQGVFPPVGLADLPPGPELGALLAGIDVSQVPNGHVVAVLRAENRQLAHQQARLFAAMAEVGRCAGPGAAGEVLRAGQPLVESIHEVGPALALTSNAAFGEHHIAEELQTRLPEVGAALLAGLIDRSQELTERQTARLTAELLPLAPRLTTGQLVDRLRRRILSMDPDALRKRYQKAVRNRAVFGYLGRDGTASFGASGLTPEEAAGSSARVFALARTIRRAGHPDSLPQIRADLFIALLDGSLQQMTNAQIVLAMLARREESEAAAAGSAQDEPETDGPAADPGAPAPGDPAANPPAPVPSGPAGNSTAPVSGGPTVDPTPVPAEEPRPGIEVRVRLSTLLGLDAHPADIPGWGAILPQPARETVARQRGAQWRFAITDAEGYLLLAGVTRHRPAPAGEVRQNAGGTVELQVPAELLGRLAAEAPPG
jgi:hypothetical protein